MSGPSQRELRAAAQEMFGERMDERKALIAACRDALPVPRALSSMVDEIAKFGLAPGDTVLDVGANHGNWTQRIVDRYGCVCLAIDVAPLRSREVRARGLPAILADAGELPFATGAAGAVWCRDMIEMHADPAAVLTEFARVLRTGGGVMLYAPVPTEALEPLEKSHMMSLDMPPWWGHGRAPLDDAIRVAGFDVLRCEVMSPEYTEGVLRSDPAAVVEQIVEHAQLRRGRAEVEAAVGAEWYAKFEAWSRWQMYLVLGKIENTLWLLRNPA